MMTWNDISVRKWIKLSALSGEDPNDFGVLTELISIVHDMDFEAVRQLPINEAIKKKEEIFNLLQNQPADDKLTESFEAEGITFTFADLQKDWIFAKNIDLAHFSKDPNNFHITLTILYYPRGLEYETDKAIELSKIIERQPIGKLYAAWYFFFLFTTASVKITTNFSLLEMMMESTKLMEKVLTNPEKLLPIVKRLLWMKLRASGALTASSITSVMDELKSGSIS